MIICIRYFQVLVHLALSAYQEGKKVVFIENYKEVLSIKKS